ncbi:CRISPR system precrRNA processing endoribonuclease RAMP protein Cas6 [Ruminococcus sp. HUN007]|uniref:CRISPR system precrRNA processing endoribonuclease RAMP protein Cas6 n=1 Tax=Ruminococcus sp. HUN007 TaxID=1514668 RepID=UPI0005D2A722|nr:CRISPR system precrRNA processing endoribonuclease RAMP protein Cas6 [Ruminococcus sp. HUN007]
MYAAYNLDKVKISGLKPAEIIKRGEIHEADYSEIADSLSGSKFRLNFMTPSTFKTGGTETGFPDISMHFLSVIRRINEFEGLNISFEDFRRAFYKCRIFDWNFTNCKYNISGRLISGMTGYTVIGLPSDTEVAALLKKIFVYASFSGTGARTGIGMGGFFFDAM